MTDQEFKDVKELWKLTYAKGAIKQAIDSAEYILQHSIPINHPLYDLLTVTMFTSYARPFGPSYPFGPLSTDTFGPAQLAFHTEDVIAFRNQLFAHSDALAMVSANHGPVLQVKCIFEAGTQQAPDPTILKWPPQKLELLLKFFYSIRKIIVIRSELIIQSFQKNRPAADGEYVLNVYDQSKPVWVLLEEVKKMSFPKAVMLNVVDSPTQ